MGADETHAILFGVICGWHEALPEVAEKFGWSEDDIETNPPTLSRRNLLRIKPSTLREDRSAATMVGFTR
jgi:hypothetical protein